MLFFGPNGFMRRVETKKSTVGGILLVRYHHRHQQQQQYRRQRQQEIQICILIQMMTLFEFSTYFQTQSQLNSEYCEYQDPNG